MSLRSAQLCSIFACFLVAPLAARRELDARAQAAESDGEGRQDIAKAQISGENSVSARETEEARQTELRGSADHIAGAQSVIPDPSFSPRSSGVDQQSLQAAYGSSFPLSAPPSTSRPVSAPTPSLNIEETPGSYTPTRAHFSSWGMR